MTPAPSTATEWIIAISLCERRAIADNTRARDPDRPPCVPQLRSGTCRAVLLALRPACHPPAPDNEGTGRRRVRRAGGMGRKVRQNDAAAADAAGTAATAADRGRAQSLRAAAEAASVVQ